MKVAELERLDDIGIRAWDTHDVDSFLELFADDFIWTDWALPGPMRTRDEARAYFNGWMTAFPDLKVTSHLRVVGENAVAGELEFTGTNTGPMIMAGNTIPPTGKQVIGRGSYTVKVRNGKIAEFHTHPDIAGMLMQLGIVPQM